jgi:hypothetical protein
MRNRYFIFERTEGSGAPAVAQLVLVVRT